MIKNNWKKMLQKAGLSQNSVADQALIGRDVMSRACSGVGVMPKGALDLCCDILQCSPLDIYSDATLRALYQIEIAEEVKKEPSTVCVRIKKHISDEIDSLVDEGLYISRNDAVNALLRSKLS